MKRMESARAEWPRTAAIKGGGIRISGSYVQPWLAQAMPGMFGLITLAYCAMVFAGTGNIIAATIWGALMALLYPVLWKRSLINMLGKLVDIRVYPDRLQIRRGFCRKNYDRRVPIALWSETHGGVAEAIMQYGERRIVLAQMPLADIDRAEALLARLQEALAATRSVARSSQAGRYSPY